MSERKTRRKDLFCAINCMLEHSVYYPNIQLIQRENISSFSQVRFSLLLTLHYETLV